MSKTPPALNFLLPSCVVFQIDLPRSFCRMILVVFFICLASVMAEVRFPSFLDSTFSRSIEGSHSSFRSSSRNNELLSSETIMLGYVYYNFYSNNDCTGSITYQTGVAVNTCLSSDYYGIPYNDSVIIDFGSFIVLGLTGSYLFF
jgi:hypothetical protein